MKSIITTLIFCFIVSMAYSQNSSTRKAEEKATPMMRSSQNHPMVKINKGDSVVRTPMYSRIIRKEKIKPNSTKQNKNRENSNSNNSSGTIKRQSAENVKRIKSK